MKTWETIISEYEAGNGINYTQCIETIKEEQLVRRYHIEEGEKVWETIIPNAEDAAKSIFDREQLESEGINMLVEIYEYEGDPMFTEGKRISSCWALDVL